MNKNLEKIIDKITPNQKEKREVQEICKKIKKIAEKNSKNLGVKVEFCGSIAKKTWLKGEKDIDLFLLFQKNVSKDDLEKYGLKIGKETAKKLQVDYKIAYAEHPYTKLTYQGHKIDIVPAYDIKNPNKIKSSVDRTPHHVRYVMENLDSELRKDVRLLKKFCKGVGVYGSSLKIRGFSGYLCELLIIKYGEFENVLKNSLNWKPGFVIDLEDYYKNYSYLRNKKFKGDALIFVDPVDKDRNVSSVLSAENMFWFKKKAKEFLEESDPEIFYRGKTTCKFSTLKKKIKKRESKFILITFNSPDVHEDILWPQMRKAKRRLSNLLKKEEFPVLNSGEWSNGDKCVLIFELETDSLPQIEKRRGPGIFDWENSKGFLERYKADRILIENNQWVVEKSRENTNPEKLLKKFLKKKSEELRKIGIPKYLSKEIEKNLKVFSKNEIYELLKENKNLRICIKKLLEKDLVS